MLVEEVLLLITVVGSCVGTDYKMRATSEARFQTTWAQGLDDRNALRFRVLARRAPSLIPMVLVSVSSGGVPYRSSR